MPQKKLIVTTSWDDGNKLDFKLIQLLDRYSLKATFYIPKNYFHRTLLNKEIVELSKEYEIGAHSLTHPDLTKIDEEEAKREIEGSKKYLEDLIGKEIKIFSYPFGKFNKRIEQVVQEAGFIGARTTQEFCINFPKISFSFGTTLHIYPFPLRKKDKRHYHLSRVLFQPLTIKFRDMIRLKLPLNSFFSWKKLAFNLFNQVVREGGIFHLWGHSYEIERFDMWQDLEEVFKYTSRREGIKYLTNGEILKNGGETPVSFLL